MPRQQPRRALAAATNGALSARAHTPQAPGFERRAKLYQLYHYLNHVNLFGGGAYYGGAASLLRALTDHA